MSKNLNERVSRWKDLEVQLRGTTQSPGLSHSDTLTYIRSIVLQCALLDDLLSRFNIPNYGTLIRWAKYCASSSPHRVVSSFKEMLSFFRNYESYDRMTFSAFKQQMTNKDMSGILLSPIKPYVLGFLEEPNARDFSVINQHLSFLTRLNLESYDYSCESMEAWYETEETLSSLSLPEYLVNELNLIIRDWFKDWSPPSPIMYKHGSGAVAEVGANSIFDKSLIFSTDTRMRYCGVGSEYRNIDRTNRVIFVPKSLTNWRVISMEPAALQWFQQGVWGSLKEFLKTHKVLSRHVRIEDQSQNRRLALLGSLKPYQYATVDLTAASDSVSWSLVKGMFRGTPILRYFLASRSEWSLLPDGNKVHIQKFAPMGSAICFPVESIVFCAICENIRRKIGHKREFYSVYGDDIIVPPSWAPSLLSDLADLGFKVNKTKSFISPLISFRESCGVEAFLGSDVTPIKLPRNFRYSEKSRLVYSPSEYSMLIELANNFFNSNYRIARMLILADLLSLPERFRPLFDEDGSTGICSCSPTNFHLKRVYDSAYQHWFVEYCSIASETEFETGPWHDIIQYYEWHRTHTNTVHDNLAFLDEVATTQILKPRPKLGRFRQHVVE